MPHWLLCIFADVDMDLLTDDTDPFMCKVREMRGHQVTTRYCSMSDKDIMAKYGRKVKVIGRPPGRPSKSSQQTVCFTCTMCESQMATVSELLTIDWLSLSLYCITCIVLLVLLEMYYL